MSQTFPIPDPTEMWLYVQDLTTRTDTLRSNFSGPDEPSAPVTGQNWFEDDVLVPRYFDGSGWVEYGTAPQSDVDFGFNLALNFRVENTGATPTASAGTVGNIVLHTGAAKLKVVTTDAIVETVVSVSNADLQPVPLTRLEVATTDPPNLVDVGTSPVWRTWEFDDLVQRLDAEASIPHGFSGDANMLLRLHCLLGAVETAADTIDVVVDYRTLIPGSTDTADGLSSQATASVSIGANAGVNTYHRADVVLPFADANNPLVADNALAMSIGANALGGAGKVALFRVFKVELLSPTGSRGLTEVA